MRTFAAAALLVLASVAAAPAYAAPGGFCQGAVDFDCKPPCQPDELDCGMKQPCLVWLGGACLPLPL